MIEGSPNNDPDVLRALDRNGRRLGFVSTMRNHAAAAVVGLHATDWAALDLLDWAGPLPTGRLGAELGLSPAAATSLVDRLEHRGLVERARDPDDRRRTIVRPRPGRAPDYERLDDQLRERMVEHARQFTRAELETVLRFMVGAADVLEEIAGDLRRAAAGRPPDPTTGTADRGNG